MKQYLQNSLHLFRWSSTCSLLTMNFMQARNSLLSHSFPSRQAVMLSDSLGKCEIPEPKSKSTDVSINRSKLLPPSCWNRGKNPAVLIACGSYSPPTIMHTRIFETAKDHFEGTSIQIIGGFISPVHDAYGKKDLAPAHHRIEMVKRALETSDWINLDEWEARQAGWTRTRECMDRMYSELNKENGVFLTHHPPSPFLSFCVTGNLVVGAMLRVRTYPKNCRHPGGREVRVMLLCGADVLQSMNTPGARVHALIFRERPREGNALQSTNARPAERAAC